MKDKIIHIAYLLMFIVTFISCKEKKGHYSVIEKLHHAPPMQSSKSSEPFIDGIEIVKVDDSIYNFFVPKRIPHIKDFECTSCHSKPLSDMNHHNEKMKKAHWDITLNHADIKVMNCATCHDPKNMDKLKMLVENEVSLDHSYKVCAQCHNSQYKDWKGGSHGKRIGGWAPPRASKTCVNCHNPHSPQISPRWPSRFNTKKIEERK